ncbi:hypothetical protein C5G87_15390 [Paenibacillus peoriae]|uniref:ATP-binding protein n=1 Tax=Paenibacillus peoriae TaxID=59893 RepID=UPI000CEC9EDF|nr:ATP-binding protein [Paenibacillus peoriae]PPQ47512.1 hypothetical protein C5G87_15390 [Paenibacillus peoriae]
MGLGQAHKGYEYQDLLSGLFIIENLLNDVSATVKIDKKESLNDKFDDLTIISPTKITKRQIKYSEDKVLVKADFSTANYDLALDVLFKSWKETNKLKKTELRICLGWEYIEDKDDLGFLKTIECENIYNDSNVKFLKIDIDRIWEKGQLPISTWRRLRGQHQFIDREEFSSFLDDLIIEINLPKASNDIASPAALEKLVFSKLKQFGVGKYPNDHKSVGDVLLNLTHIIKNARANGEELKLNDIVYKLGLKSNYGNIIQNFAIDEDTNVIKESKYYHFNDFVFSNKKTILIGEPGAGKSWFIQNYLKYIRRQNIKVIQHYCYTGMDDIFEKERITINVFLANLINDFIASYPELAIHKNTKYGVDIDELQTLLNKVEEETVLIIDGLDHIGRVYNFHKAIIKQVEIEIIKVLSQLEFPEKIHVILASQPVSEVINLTEQGYEIYDIVPWDEREVEDLLVKNNLENQSLNRETNLSGMLIQKSNGNPLYLTYLINELAKNTPSFLSVEYFAKFPPYNNNLTNYYEYLLSQIPASHKVPQVLAGAPFRLTKRDLIEITGLGMYVEESIEAIKSILRLNICNGGYTIYHESFRRYILETLEKKEVNVERLIYGDLIDWLKEKGFYNTSKSYLNLIVLLFESKRYEEILSYCNKEFVVDSIFYGNNLSSLKSNFEILIKTACIKKDYGALIVCTELSNMIYSLEYSFDENSELYYEGLGIINGFSNLKDTLLYEGQMALSIKQGLKVCYLCSKNNLIPEWEPYIEALVNRKNNYNSDEEKELYRYYICACLDMGWDMIERLSLVRSKQLEVHRQIAIEEYSRRNELDKLDLIIDEISDNEHWKKSLAAFLGEIEIDHSLVNQVFDSLKVADSHSDETMKAITYYVDNISKIVKCYHKELDSFLVTINNRNWFFNWIRYIAEVNRSLQNIESEEFEKNIINAYRWLTQDTAPFKGSPRTCDLYNYKDFIYKTIKIPMNFIKSNDTWQQILEIVRIMSEETTTLLQGSTGGPLPTYLFLNLLMEIANEENNEVILGIIDEKISKENKYRFYSYLADYSFKHATILAKAGKQELSEQAFKQGVVYSLSYSFRKDRTLSHLLDSVLSTYNVDNEVGLCNILKLKPLADAVVFHTDGKSTKTYQREWFELLISIDINLAITYIRDELVQHVSHWIVEDSLESLLIAFNSGKAPKIENALFKTFPNNITEEFIAAYVNNIEWLLEKNLYVLAMRSVSELMSRFDSEDKAEYLDHNLIGRLKILCDSLGLEWNGKVHLKERKKFGDSRSTPSPLYIHRKGIEEFSYVELLEYLKEYQIRNEDYMGIFYYLNQKMDSILNEDNKTFLRGLVHICFDNRLNESSRDNLIEIINNLSLSNEIMAFLYMNLFVQHTDDWYKKFTNFELFKKAHEYDSTVAEEVFFEYIYNNFYSVDYSLAVGGEIINALAAINYNHKLVLEYWENLFEIINFRLSGQSEFDWGALRAHSDDFDIEEKMISLLLSRLKYGESNRFKWIQCELDNLLDDKVLKLKFIKPFIQFVDERDKYVNYAMVILLVLIKKHYSFSELIETKLKDVLEEIYPTSDSLTNYLLRSIIRKNSIRIYSDYNKKQSFIDERTKFIIKRISRIDNRVALVDGYGVDIENVIYGYVNKTFEESFVEEKREILFNRIYHSLIPNVYFYDVLTQQLGMEAEDYLKVLSGSSYVSEIEDVIYNAVLDDIPLILAQHSSIISRPRDIVLPEFVEEGVKEVVPDDWMRIGYFEKWFNKIEKYKENFGSNTDAITVISGVGFGGETTMVPFIRLDGEYRFLQENEYEFIIPEIIYSFKAFLTSNISFLNDPYLTYNTKQYLGVRDDVLQCLGIRMIDTGCGIVGISKEGEEVIKLSRWEVSHVDDNDHIPYLIGSQLLMKKEKFEELCSYVQEKPLLYTTKFDLSPTE